jgi:hypothetical protein
MATDDLIPQYRTDKERNEGADRRDMRIIALDRAVTLKSAIMSTADVLMMATKIEEWLNR